MNVGRHRGVMDQMEELEHMINGRKLFAKPPTSDLIHTYNPTTQINVLALRENDKPK